MLVHTTAIEKMLAVLLLVGLDLHLRKYLD